MATIGRWSGMGVILALACIHGAIPGCADERVDQDVRDNLIISLKVAGNRIYPMYPVFLEITFSSRRDSGLDIYNDLLEIGFWKKGGIFVKHGGKEVYAGTMVEHHSRVSALAMGNRLPGDKVVGVGMPVTIHRILVSGRREGIFDKPGIWEIVVKYRDLARSEPMRVTVVDADSEDDRAVRDCLALWDAMSNVFHMTAGSRYRDTWQAYERIRPRYLSVHGPRSVYAPLLHACEAYAYWWLADPRLKDLGPQGRGAEALRLLDRALAGLPSGDPVREWMLLNGVMLMRYMGADRPEVARRLDLYQKELLEKHPDGFYTWHMKNHPWLTTEHAGGGLWRR